MWRRILNALTLLSLLLAIGVAGLWVRGHGAIEGELLHLGPFFVTSERGIGFGCAPDMWPIATYQRLWFELSGSGLSAEETTALQAVMKPHLVLPYWAPLIVLSIVPLCSLILYLRRQRQPGLCPTCGYDLRASKNACPECGTTIPIPPTGIKP